MKVKNFYPSKCERIEGIIDKSILATYTDPPGHLFLTLVERKDEVYRVPEAFRVDKGEKVRIYVDLSSYKNPSSQIRDVKTLEILDLDGNIKFTYADSKNVSMIFDV